MTLLKPPTLEHMIGSPSSAVFESDSMLKFEELKKLSHAKLMSGVTTEDH